MKAMPVGVRLRVTRGSRDGTFRKGDRIELYSDGDIICIGAGGWIKSYDAPAATKGMSWEVDREHYAKLVARLELELQEARRMAG